MFFAVTGPIRRSFCNIPTLETDRLILRKILPKDLDDMYEYSRNPETSKFLLWEPHGSKNFTLAHIRYLQVQYQKASFFDWALVEKESGKMIGTCGFTEIYEKELRAEIGYVLSPSFHKKGLGAEAVQKVLHYGFFTLGLEKISARFMGDNLASKKLLEKFGFFDDTVRKETIYKRGKKQIIYTYSLLREKYKK